MFLVVLHLGDSLFYCLEVCAHTEKQSAAAGIEIEVFGSNAVKCM